MTQIHIFFLLLHCDEIQQRNTEVKSVRAITFLYCAARTGGSDSWDTDIQVLRHWPCQVKGQLLPLGGLVHVRYCVCGVSAVYLHMTGQGRCLPSSKPSTGFHFSALF